MIPWVWVRRATLLLALVFAGACSESSRHDDVDPATIPDAERPAADSGELDAGAAPEPAPVDAGTVEREVDAAAPEPEPVDAGAVQPIERDAATQAPVPSVDAGPDPDELDGGEDVAEDAATRDTGVVMPPEDDTPLYAGDHLLEFAFTLEPSDWERVRAEGRSLNEVFSYCPDPAFDYSIVPASAVIEGRNVTQIGFRKKGFIGSLSVDRPSLHLDIGEYVREQRLFGTRTIVLNNSRQDPSFTHTCMAYAVFRAAGVPAPRCSFAHVTVNGDDMGIYVHVEAIKKPFLLRHFGDDSGNLYEGSGMTDFRADMLSQFEKKTNENQPLSPEITQLTEILARPDDDILEAIEALVDMDQFMRFWASEVLVAHWDGYTGDLNNFYLYVHPVTRKLIFIPWGTDAAFEHVHPYLRKEPRPQSVYAWSRLPARLYAIEASRERFRTTLRTLISDHWDEASLLAEVDRIEALLGGRADPAEVEAQRTFIRNRRAELLRELDAPAPEWTIAPRPPLMCQPERNSAVTGSFSTTWGDLSAYTPSANNVLDVELDGTRQTFAGVFASAGPGSDGVPMLQVGALLPDGRLVAARFMLAHAPTAPGEVALHGFETYGAVVRGRSENQYAVDGFISAGKIVFEEASAATGAALRGHFEGQLITLEPALAAQYGRP